MKRFFQFLDKSESSNALFFVAKAIKGFHIFLGFFTWITIFFSFQAAVYLDVVTGLLIGLILGLISYLLILFWGLDLEALLLGLGVLVENSNLTREEKVQEKLQTETQESL